MRHQGHEKAGAHATRLITAALVLMLGAVSLAACSAIDRAGTVAGAEHAVRMRGTDASPPRLRLPQRIERLADGTSGVVVRYRSSAVDRRDGRLAARCEPASGSRFHWGITAVRCSAADRAGNVARGGFAVIVRTMPGSTPPLLCFPEHPCAPTRRYATWTPHR